MGNEQGQDYNVTYTLKSGQQGHIILRFAAVPSKRAIAAELERYGIEPTELLDSVFTPVGLPTYRSQVAPAQAGGAQMVPPGPLAIPSPHQTQQRPMVPVKPKSGCMLSSLLKGAVALYLFVAMVNMTAASDAVEEGRGLSDHPDRPGACVALVQDAKETGRIEDFPGHPVQLLMFGGCLLGAYETESS